MSSPARTTRMAGLIGNPVEHSLSPAMHNAAFAALGLDYAYALLPTPAARFETRVRECIDEGYAGWNITVPHKERMVPYLDDASEEVRATGACNTVRVEGGRLLGFNTDIEGFLAGLDEAGGIEPGAAAVVLGAGGAARAVCWALAGAGHDVVVLARRGEQADRLASSLPPLRRAALSPGTLQRPALESALARAGLLVNCTPAGMWPRVDESPLPAGTRLPPHLLVYDLVYRPEETHLLMQAAEAGCRVQGGLAMLVGQGAAAFRIWTGLPAPVDVMRRAARLDGESTVATSHTRKQDIRS